VEEIHAIFDTVEVNVYPLRIERSRGRYLAPGIHRSRSVVRAVQNGQEVTRECRHHQRRWIS
jgi:hypothetical protein